MKAEFYVPLGSEIQEFYAQQARYSAGIGYVFNKQWTLELRLCETAVAQHHRARASGTTDQFIELRLKSSFRIVDLMKSRHDGRRACVADTTRRRVGIMTRLRAHRGTAQRVCVALLFVLISAIFLRMIWGLLLAVFMAAIFTGLANPLYTRLLRLLGGRKSVAALATLVVVILVVVTPLVLIADIVATEALQISETATPMVESFIEEANQPDASLDWIPFWDQLEPYREQITKKLGEIAGAVSAFIVNSLSSAAQGTMKFFFNIFIMLYSMFFFLMGGREILDQVMRLFPLEATDKELLLDKFVSVSRATIKGTLVIGIVQGGLAGLAFAVVGIKGAVFWGTVMAVLSIIPGIGTALVWVPAVGFLLATGQTVPAVGLLLWCAIVVGTADNVLRPLLVGKDTEMPDLMVMLSTFGGLALFGAIGLVIGPVIAALFLTMWRIYSDTFADVLSTPGVSSHGS